MAYAAVELLKGKISDIRDSKVLVIGAGEMGQIVLKNLLKLELKELAITNRTRARIQDFIQGEAVKDDFANCRALKVVDWDDKIKKINEYDIVVSSTNAPHPVLYGDRVIPELEMGKRQLPLYMIDLAMPGILRLLLGKLRMLSFICLMISRR